MSVRIRALGMLVGSTVLLSAMGSGCALTGVSRSDEIRLGQQTAAEVDRQYRTYTNPTLTQIGQRIAAVSGAPDYPFSYKVIDQKEINAFALPGGPVYVTSALMQLASGHPDWLAAVVAHETAHIARRHIAEQLQRQAWLGLGIDVLTGGGSARDVAVLAANIEELGFSRNQERDADTHGAAYLVRAGYNPEAMIQFFEQLQAVAGSGGGPAFLQTHPSSPDRISRLRQQISSGEIRRLAQQSGP